MSEAKQLTWIELERYWREPALFKQLWVSGSGYPKDTDVKKKYADIIINRLRVEPVDLLTRLYAPDRRATATKQLEAAALQEGKAPLTDPEYEAFGPVMAAALEAAKANTISCLLPVQLGRAYKHFDLHTAVFQSLDGAHVYVRIVDDAASFYNTMFQARYDRMAAFTWLVSGVRAPAKFIIVDLKDVNRACVYQLPLDGDVLNLAYTEVCLMVQALERALETDEFPSVATEPITITTRPHWLPVVSSLSQGGKHLWPTLSSM
jgi:hypothetical protein